MKRTTYEVAFRTAVFPMLLCSACSSGAGADEPIGVARAQLTLAPTDAKCLVIQAQGSTTVTQQFSVSPEANSVFDLNGLPLGVDSFTAKAYNVACSAINGAAPTYASAAVIATVAASGTPVSLTFQMLPVAPAGGGATVGLNFVPSTHGVVTEFALPGVGAGVLSLPSFPLRIAAGPGGLWFTDSGTNRVGVITTSGAVTEYLPPRTAAQQGISAGPDGNVWFTSGPGIERVAPSGVVTEEAVLPMPESPFSIAAGPDGNLWFTESVNSAKLGRITPSGALTEFSISDGANGICAGPDGNIWFVEVDINKIGRLSPSGSGLKEFAIPTASSGAAQIIAAADGTLWFTEFAVGQIGRVTMGGVITEFPLPTPASQPWGITAGPDGNVWFTESRANQIGRITLSGVITEFAVPTPASTPFGIAAGPDGNLWFAELSSGMIGRITP
jgi:streptogramin lyase